MPLKLSISGHFEKKKASKVNDCNIYLTQNVPNMITLTYV